MDYGNYNEQNGYNNYNGSRQPYGRSGLATASLITGILSVVLGYCTGYLGILAGVVSIVLGIFSRGDAPKLSRKAIIGIVSGAVGFILGVSIIVTAMKMLTNPDFMKQYKDIIDFLNRK